MNDRPTHGLAIPQDPFATRDPGRVRPACGGLDFNAPNTAFPGTYQQRVNDWIQHCFGPEIGADRAERNHRFLEEALELVQSGGCTASEAHQLVDYVFGRPAGELGQEIGGVMNTLAALCTAHGADLDAEAERELQRVWGKSEQIRAKQAAKPKHSPLPEAAPLGPNVDLARLHDALEAARERLSRSFDSYTDDTLAWLARRFGPTKSRHYLDALALRQAERALDVARGEP